MRVEFDVDMDLGVAAVAVDVVRIDVVVVLGSPLVVAGEVSIVRCCGPGRRCRMC